MFTGIIQAVGRIGAMDARGGDMRVSIDAGTLPMDDVELGDSIAVSLSLIHISEPTRRNQSSRMPSSA